MKKYILTLVGIFALATMAFAGTDFKTNKDVITPEFCRFRSNELQLDAFGTGGFYKGNQPSWGGGLAVNYFFNKFVGLGTEQNLVAHSNIAEWGTFGNVFVRYPICKWNVAPYAVAGIGGIYGQGREGVLAGTVGGGLEYRITDHIGLFGDARWLYNASKSDSGALLARTGLRYSF